MRRTVSLVSVFLLSCCGAPREEKHVHLQCVDPLGRVAVDTADVDGTVWQNESHWSWESNEGTRREISTSYSCVAEYHRVAPGEECSCPEHEVMRLFGEPGSAKAERE